MEKWKLIGEEVSADLEQLDDLVYPDETDTDSDEDSESNSIVDRILEWHLQIENYNYDQQLEMLEALKRY